MAPFIQSITPNEIVVFYMIEGGVDDTPGEVVVKYGDYSEVVVPLVWDGYYPEPRVPGLPEHGVWKGQLNSRGGRVEVVDGRVAIGSSSEAKIGYLPVRRYFAWLPSIVS